MKSFICAAMLASLWATTAMAQAPAAKSGDTAMAGYFGNTMLFRDQAGKIIEIVIYRPDRTVRQWRDGVWGEGTWVLNNGQDSSTICQTRERDGVPMTWCHAFAANKKVGDHWINPENKGGHPETVGGIALVQVNGKWALPDAPAGSAAPETVISLEKGIVQPPYTK